MKKPNFFIIGAPKCGTTSLATWLSEHPDIYISPVKEPHFFNRDGMYQTESLEEYESLFSMAEEKHIAVGEASTHYLFSCEAVPRILDYTPDAKMIVCIRNPIDMVQSLHSERVWNGVETINVFEKAWRLQDLRKQGLQIPRTIRRDPKRLQYGEYCKLGEQINRLYTLVPRDRVLVLLLDDIASNPQKEYFKVLNFLGITENLFTPLFVVHNPRKAVRSTFISYSLRILYHIRKTLGIKKPLNLYGKIQSSINSKKPRKQIISNELMDELVTYFENDVHLLEQLLQRDFSHWLKLQSPENGGKG